MERIGFIGLGTMGKPMAQHLLKAGYPFSFFSRKEEVRRAFALQGGKCCASPAEVTAASDRILTIVTADADVESVVLGENGVLASAAPDKILIDMSTIGPWTAKKVASSLAAKGMQMLDAPVSGGPWGAQNASLSIMVGGEASTFNACRPVLERLGKHIFRVGPSGAGQTVKLINQMIGAGIMALIAEGFVLAKNAGANLELLADILAVSSANSSLLAARGKPFLLANQFTPGFATQLMRKDLGLSMEMARQLEVPMPVSAVVLQQYTAAIKMGYAELDFSAVAKVWEHLSGTQLVEGTPPARTAKAT